MTIWIEKGGQQAKASFNELEKWTKAAYLSHLEFESCSVLKQIQRLSQKASMYKEWAPEQLWLGKYFEKEILKAQLPDIFLRWIDDGIGWGVFSQRDFKEMEFITSYSGVVRKYTKRDVMNSYCFEFHLLPQEGTPFTIDAREKGGIGRYLNHSQSPNLTNVLATIDGMTHVIFYTRQPIAKGTQLTFDYGSQYWKKRPPPRNF